MTGNNSGDTPVQIRMSDAQRISDAVLWVESHRRPRQSSMLPRAAGGGGGGGTSIRTAYFYGGWLVSTSKQVTFASNTAETAACANYLQTLTPAVGSGQNPRICFVMPDDTGGTGYLLVNGGC